jgi:hypothetical protein
MARFLTDFALSVIGVWAMVVGDARRSQRLRERHDLTMHNRTLH